MIWVAMVCVQRQPEQISPTKKIIVEIVLGLF